ncbi:MAG: CotH kinase family protein, partial [Thermoanaerobaculia bacterium]
HLACEDAEGRRGTFPREAPERSALYAVGLRPAAGLPAYTLLVAERDWAALMAAPRLSNRLTDASFVYGDRRIFYNVGFRARGSPWTRRKSNNWKLTFGAETLDGRRSLMLDRQYGHAHPNERIVYWLIDALRAPSLRSRYVHLSIPGREEGICEDVEEVDRRFLRRWFGRSGGEEGGAAGGTDGAAGLLFKVNDYIELADEGFRRGMRLRQRAALEVRTDDPEDYRWNFYPRSGGSRDDLVPIVKLAELFDPGATPDEEFLRRVEAEADLDEWIRVFAARAAAGDWDTLGRHGGKNAFLFLPGATHRWLLLPWDCDQTGLRHPPDDPIVSRGHPAFVRFLGLPRYRRAYLGALAYLATRKLEPEALDAA